jgi:PhnB protein
MMLRLNPYLSFHHDARAAMEFYQSVFGGQLEISTFADYPDSGLPPEEEHLVMHAMLTTDDGLILMGSDTPSGMPYVEPAGMTVSLSGDDGATLQRYWTALADGGTVTLPYETPPWGGTFGMLTDRFGVPWMVAADA